MAIVVVQHAAADGPSSTSVSLSGVTSGNLLLLGAWNNSIDGVNTPSDGVNTYTLVGGSSASNPHNSQCWMWYAANVTGGSITVSWSPLGGLSTLSLVEVSGAAVSSPLDNYTTGYGDNSVPSVSTLTPANANELVYFIVGDARGLTSYTNATGWTTLSSYANGTYEYGYADLYQVQMTATGITSAVNSGDTSYKWAAVAAAFKPGASASVPPWQMPPFFLGSK